MHLLEGRLRDYDWGSPTAIPELLGRPATGAPVAELWLGAHPSAPALVGVDGRPLDEVIGSDPVAALGPIADRFDSLPFLLKVLAAAAPLSLQAHPSAAQAAEGFARENAAGIPLDARHRTFRDPHHKPELICALTDFDALCGVRDPATTVALLDTIPTHELDPVRAMLRDDPSPDGVVAVLRWLLTLGPTEAGRLVDAVVDACGGDGADGDGPDGAARSMAVWLAARHPGDAGVVTALLLNRVTLRPGEALFLDAGNLHAYLGGVGVELMANSDNVVRGGLTSKHVDVETLLDVVDPRPIEPAVQRPVPVDGVATYHSPVDEFALQRVDLDGAIELDPGPAILLCTHGHATSGDHVLDRGAAAWVPARDGAITVEGTATLFRAGVGSAGSVH